MNNALKGEGFESSLKLPDKVLTFVRDHPLMENTVAAAPLLVRKGIKYTKLAVTQTGSGEELRAVLHLGTGVERREERVEGCGGQNMSRDELKLTFKTKAHVDDVSFNVCLEII